MTDIKDLSKKLREAADRRKKGNWVGMIADCADIDTLLDELDRLIEVEKVLREKLVFIQQMTISDPAEGPELRSRAECVYRSAVEALKRADEIGKGKMEKPREFWHCPWCGDLNNKNSVNGYCQQCFEKKLVQLKEASLYDQLLADARELQKAFEHITRFPDGEPWPTPEDHDAVATLETFTKKYGSAE